MNPAKKESRRERERKSTLERGSTALSRTLEHSWNTLSFLLLLLFHGTMEHLSSLLLLRTRRCWFDRMKLPFFHISHYRLFSHSLSRTWRRRLILDSRQPTIHPFTTTPSPTGTTTSSSPCSTVFHSVFHTVFHSMFHSPLFSPSVLRSPSPSLRLCLWLTEENY